MVTVCLTNYVEKNFDYIFARYCTYLIQAFSLRVYLDDDGLRNTEDTDDKLDKSMLEEGEAADSDEYSDSLESVVEQAVEEEESDLEDSDSYDGDVAPDTFAQYNFIDEKTKNR